MKYPNNGGDGVPKQSFQYQDWVTTSLDVGQRGPMKIPKQSRLFPKV